MEAKELHTASAEQLDIMVAVTADALMAVMKRHLVTEIQRNLAASGFSGGYELAANIASTAIHESTGTFDPMPNFGRYFEQAEGELRRGIREAAVHVAREQVDA